jgi:hypothetical protein
MRLRSSGQTSYALAGASECGPFLANEADRILGPNYQGLLAAKRAYDHAALFFVRRGTGSGHWSDDGFTRLEECPARRPLRGPLGRNATTANPLQFCWRLTPTSQAAHNCCITRPLSVGPGRNGLAPRLWCGAFPFPVRDASTFLWIDVVLRHLQRSNHRAVPLCAAPLTPRPPPGAGPFHRLTRRSADLPTASRFPYEPRETHAPLLIVPQL